MKILGFGSCNIDTVLSVDHTVRPGETIAASRVEVFPGGKGLNQSLAAARALKDTAIPVFHAGCIGADGAFLRELLESSGADTRYLKQVDTRTGFALIQVDPSGENSIVVSAAANEEVSPGMMEEVLENFEPGDYLLMQNEISHPDELLRRAREKGLRVVLNPSPLNQRIASLDMHMVSFLLVNRLEAETIFGTSDPEELSVLLQARYPGVAVVMTLGAKGSVYMKDGETVRQEAYPVKAVDTTGAGDTFTGYFTAALASGKTVEEALRRGSAASALSVTRMGAAASIPERDETDTFIAQNRTH